MRNLVIATPNSISAPASSTAAIAKSLAVHFTVRVNCIATRRTILRGRWSRDQRGIDDSPFAHHQTLLGEMTVDGVEDILGQPIGLKPMPKFQQCRRVRRGLSVEVDADETTNGLAIVDRVLDAFIRQTKASLGHVHAQHARQANRRTARALDLRIKPFDFLMQLAPRRGLVDLCKKAVTPRQLLFVDVLEVGKLFCVIDKTMWEMQNYLRPARPRERLAVNKSVLPK